MASGMWKGAGYGAVLFLVIVGVGALTPLRVPLLKVAGRDYAALQLQQRAADAAASSRGQPHTQVHAPDRERVAVRLEAWHKRNENLSLVGLLGWVLDVWPWLWGLGLGLPVLGALIGAQSGVHAGGQGGFPGDTPSRSVRGPGVATGTSSGLRGTPSVSPSGTSNGPRVPLATTTPAAATPLAPSVAAAPRGPASPSPSAALFGQEPTTLRRASTPVEASAPLPPLPLHSSTEPVVESPVSTPAPVAPVAPFEPAPAGLPVTGGEVGEPAAPPAAPLGEDPIVPSAPAASATPLPPSEWSWNARPAPRRTPGRPKPPPVQSPNSDAV